MLDRVGMAAATIPRGDERMRPSTGRSGIGRPDCCRPPCAAHTANALLAMAGLLGQTIIVPTMAETLSSCDVLGQSSGLLSSVVRPLEEHTVGFGRLRWIVLVCWKR